MLAETATFDSNIKNFLILRKLNTSIKYKLEKNPFMKPTVCNWVIVQEDSEQQSSSEVISWEVCEEFFFLHMDVAGEN